MFVSEPPDIRNWFSSYVYESPEPDSVGSLKMSVYRDIQLDHQDNWSKLNSQEEGNNRKHRQICRNEIIVDEKNDIASLNEGRSPLESDDTNVLIPSLWFRVSKFLCNLNFSNQSPFCLYNMSVYNFTGC